MANPPDDMFVKKAQFTKTVYRDVYPSVDPTNPTNSMAGKVIVITGPSKGLGRIVSPRWSRSLDTLPFQCKKVELIHSLGFRLIFCKGWTERNGSRFSKCCKSRRCS